MEPSEIGLSPRPWESLSPKHRRATRTMSLQTTVGGVVRLPQRDGAPQRGRGSHPVSQAVGSRMREALAEDKTIENIEHPQDNPEVG